MHPLQKISRRRLLERGGLLAAGVASLLAVGGLGTYGTWFIRKMGRIR